MGIADFPHHRSSFIDRKSSAWDPCVTLEIVNPDRGYLTCVGYAPSQRRRCRNPIAAENRSRVYTMLEALANTSPDSRSVKPQLKQIAALSLCRRYHQDQVDSVVAQWLSRISLMEHPLRRRQSSQCDDEELDPYHARPKANKGFNWQSWSSASQAPEGTSRTSNSKCRCCEQRPEEHQRAEEHQRGEERGRWEQKRQETRRAEEERQETRRAEEKEREETRRAEEKKRQETRRAEEKERQEMRQAEEEERQEREREARAERERQNERARKQAAKCEREERQKQAQGIAKQERKAWDQAWEDYVKGWAVFKECKQEKSQDSIPWPVKSGRRADVTEANVKVFFRKAPPDASVPATMFKIMSMENKKWHPDKISLVLGGERPEDVAMIGRTVIQLRAMAKDERDKAEQTI